MVVLGGEVVSYEQGISLALGVQGSAASTDQQRQGGGDNLRQEFGGVTPGRERQAQ